MATSRRTIDRFPRDRFDQAIFEVETFTHILGFEGLKNEGVFTINEIDLCVGSAALLGQDLVNARTNEEFRCGFVMPEHDTLDSLNVTSFFDTLATPSFFRNGSFPFGTYFYAAVITECHLGS